GGGIGVGEVRGVQTCAVEVWVLRVDGGAGGDVGGGNLGVAVNVGGGGNVEGDAGERRVGIGDGVVNRVVRRVGPLPVRRAGQGRSGERRVGRGGGCGGRPWDG